MGIKEKIIEFVKNFSEIEIVLLYEEYDNSLIILNKIVGFDIYDKIYSFMTEIDVLCFATDKFCNIYNENEKYEDSLTHFREHNVLDIIYDKESII